MKFADKVKLRDFNSKKKVWGMGIEVIVILLCIGMFAGVFSGMVGIGGGIIMVPALVLLVGMSQHEAQSTSLAITLPPITLLSVMQYYKAGYFNWKYATVVAIAFFIGSYFGGKIAVGMSEAIIKKVFACFLILVAIKMLIIDK